MHACSIWNMLVIETCCFHALETYLLDRLVKGNTVAKAYLGFGNKLVWVIG